MNVGDCKILYLVNENAKDINEKYTVTAKRVCKNDETHEQEAEKCTVTSETKDVTCTKPGTITYPATGPMFFFSLGKSFLCSFFLSFCRFYNKRPAPARCRMGSRRPLITICYNGLTSEVLLLVLLCRLAQNLLRCGYEFFCCSRCISFPI